jgi:predicted AlkP superfamily phosphohydrolase/phosphomutase
VDAQAARFWDVASARGETVGIYNWLNTSPATEVKGFLWGFGAVPPNRYPVDLDPDWEAPREPPAGPGSAWAEGMLPSQQAEFDHFVDLARRFDPDLLAYYTHFGDGVNHLNWKREAHDDAFFFPGLLTHDFEPGEATVIAMRFIDAILGEYRRRLPDDTTFLVVSDHGFDFRGYEHDNGPAGVVIARGPSIQPGLIEGASLYDVAPTVLHILGLPVADDMESGPLRIAAAGSPLDREPERIATHGPAARPLTSDTPASPADAREHEEYLKALGYVN